MADWTTPSAIHSKCGETNPGLAVNAIDENTGTKWYHVFTHYHWIIFDMGASKDITQVRIFQDDCDFGYNTNTGEDYGVTVYVSNDPADMGSAVWEGFMSGTGWVLSGTFSKNGRYVKLVSKTNYDYQFIYEFDALVTSGIAYTKTVSEILGLVDGKSSKTAFHKTTSEVLGLVDDYDKNRCKKCKPSVTLTF